MSFSALRSQTTLVAGDLAFTGYYSAGANAAADDQFSFVLLTNITAGTTIKFTDRAWLRTSPSTGSFSTMETTSITWTATTGLSAGQEIKIQELTATLASGPGSPGTVTGTALSLSTNGEAILAYQGSDVSPTFITALHMNVYTNGIPAEPITTAADWDGSYDTFNSCGLPSGLTTGVNAIWIGEQGIQASEFDNSRFLCGMHNLSTVAAIKAVIFDKNNWSSSNGTPPGFTLPTGCSYVTAVPAPNFTTNPVNTNICENANASFNVVASGATDYQWQVNTGMGFVNIMDGPIYSGTTTTTLNLTEVPLTYNNYIYRCVASNGSGSTNSTNGTLTVTALPLNPTLSTKTPNANNVADGTPVSATFAGGSGGTGCSNDYRYTTNGGATYLPYTPGSNISTTGLAAGNGTVFIQGRRANCSAGCQNAYITLASWYVTPLPASATTLNAGDIAFSGYISSIGDNTQDRFSFVLLRNIGAGTSINFTDNSWLDNNTFRTGETTITWTSNAAYPAGTEITIQDLSATLANGNSAGTVTGSGLSLSTTGDQILAYRGLAASPTFISAIHMNVYVAGPPINDPVTTTAAAWDGTNSNNTNASSLPTGLTTGTSAIWVGIQGVSASEVNNARYDGCLDYATLGSISELRAALNNPGNWIKDDVINGSPPFTVPASCNYLAFNLNSTATITVTGTLLPFSTCANTPSTAQSFTVSGSGLTNPIAITPPAGYEISLSMGSGYAGSLSLTPSSGNVASTTIFVRLAAQSAGNPAGNIVCSSNPASSVNVAATGTVNALPVLTLVPSSQSICNGNAITDIVATSSVMGTTFTWTRSNVMEVTGIASNGNSNVSGSMTNTTTSPITVTFSFVPVANGCTGPTADATVVVNTFNTIASGDYFSPSTWAGNCVPPNPLPVGAIVTINNNITNNGVIINNGTITNNGSFINNGTYKGTGTFTGTIINNGIVAPGL